MNGCQNEAVTLIKIVTRNLRKAMNQNFSSLCFKSMLAAPQQNKYEIDCNKYKISRCEYFYDVEARVSLWQNLRFISNRLLFLMNYKNLLFYLCSVMFYLYLYIN